MIHKSCICLELSEYFNGRETAGIRLFCPIVAQFIKTVPHHSRKAPFCVILIELYLCPVHFAKHGLCEKKGHTFLKIPQQDAAAFSAHATVTASVWFICSERRSQFQKKSDMELI